MVLPHYPFVLPPDASCEDDSDQCRFEQMVNRVDHNVGRIYDKLNTLGLLDNTLVLFTADNGTDVRRVSYLNGEAVYGDKHMPTDNGTRVPLIAHVPGQTAGRVVEDLIDITDILPTVADAAGIEVPADQALDGVSFWEQLQGNSGTPREWIYTYYFPRPHLSHFDRPGRHPEISYVRGVRYKLYSTGDLFDVTTDPEELHALAADDIDSAAARTSLQAVLDSMPTRGERIAQDLDGFAPGGLLRPRERPVLSDATVNRDELTLSYAGAVRRSPAPWVESFTVTVDGYAVEVSAVEVSAVEVSASGAGTSAVTLTLESEVVIDQVVTVSYVPGSRRIRHARLGNPAAPLSGVAVVNDTPPNDPPTITGPASVTYAEAATGPVATYRASDPQGDTVNWTLSGSDALRFDIDRDGMLAFEEPPDFESPTDNDLDNVYAVVVEASDGRLTTTHAVSVTVTNEDEPGRVDLSSRQPQVGAALSAELSDDDGVLSESWSWQRSQNLSDWSDIGGATANSYTPVEADEDHWLRALAAYEDGHGEGKQRHGVSDARTRAAPVTNVAPRLVPAQVERSVVENSGAGSRVGAPVTATDADGDPLTYTLSGPDAASFDVHASTGQITVGAGVELDHETRAAYAVTVTAADPSLATASTSVTIMVIDVNEAPVAADDAATTDGDRPVVIDVLANDSDPEGANLTVTVRTGPRRGTATVEADGTVRFTPGVSYRGTATFTYRVSDGLLHADAAVSITASPVKIVLESELAPGRQSDIVSAVSGYSIFGNLGGTLSPDSFVLGGTTHRVQFLAHAGGSLWLGVSPKLPADFILSVGDSTYLGSHSMVPDIAAVAGVYWWRSAVPDPFGDDPVAIRLTLYRDDQLGDLQRAPVTGYFSGAPSEHDGNEDVSFRVYFSEGVATTADALRDHVLSVSGGTVSGVEAVGSTKRIWAVSVTPDARVPITVEIEAGLDCELPDAVCAADGRRLFTSMVLTVQPRPNTPATGAPTISGTPEVGQTLTVDTAGISDADGMTAATLSYQWLSYDGRRYSDIAGATATSYTAVDADEGKAFKVRVWFTDDAGYEESLTSALARSDRPYALTATASDGAVALTWKLPAGFPYQRDYYRIMRNRPELGEAEPLVHVTYTETGQLAHTDTDVEPGVLYVYRVRGVDFLGLAHDASEPAEIRTPESTPAPNTPATGTPTISGTPQVGQTLTADTSAISDADGTTNAAFSYQWQANESDIADATGSTHTLTSSDAAQTIRVRVSFTDDADNTETLTSAATAAVTAGPIVQPPAKPAKPAVSSVAHDSVTIGWDDPGDSSITGYQILRREPAVHDAGVFPVIVSDTATAATSYTDTAVAASTQYVYRVKAINAAGLSPSPASPTPRRPPRQGPQRALTMRASTARQPARARGPLTGPTSARPTPMTCSSGIGTYTTGWCWQRARTPTGSP